MLFEKLESLQKRYNELLGLITKEETTKNYKKYKEISIELAKLEPITKKYKELKKIVSQIEEDKKLLESSDKELIKIAKEEIEELQKEKKKLEDHIKDLLIKDEQEENRDVILEIRAGTGGEEAALFASDLLRMYTRYAELKKWETEILKLNYSSLKGIKEAIITLKGDKAYMKLKNESGVHRVQRVPETETSGRIHTSTATVAVLPKVDPVEIKINPNDLKIDAFGASGPGGQNVNRTSNAIRVTHKSSGIVVSIQDEKSQYRNKEKALTILRAKLFEIEQRKKQSKIAKKRKTQVGTGERSEKIRTYNFPQNRITDHRINESVHNLEEFFDGHLDEMVGQLIKYEKSQKIKEKLENNEWS